MSNALIGKRLRALRGDTPRKFVAQTLGISVSALQMYENGARVPRDEIKVKIASYYKTTVEAIFFADIPHERSSSKGRI